MGMMLEDAKALRDLREQREKRLAAINEQLGTNSFVDDMRAIKEMKELENQRATLFIDNARYSLLEAALNKVYLSTFGSVSEGSLNVAHNLMRKYVEEKGAYNLLSNFRYKTYLLSEISRMVNDTTDKMVKSMNEKKDVSVDSSDEQDFFDSLEDEEEVQAMTDIIKMKVMDAEEEFILDNTEDKMDTTEIIQNTEDRLSAIKDSKYDDEAKEKMTNEASISAKRQINAIAYDKPKTVFNYIVHKLSEDALKEEAQGYTTESGSIDIEAIVETARVVYAFIETVNTMKIETVDKEYIGKMISGL